MMALVDMNQWLSDRGIYGGGPTTSNPGPSAPANPPLEDQLAAMQATIEAQNETIFYQSDLIRKLQAALREKVEAEQKSMIVKNAGPRTARVVRKPRERKA